MQQGLTIDLQAKAFSELEQLDHDHNDDGDQHQNNNNNNNNINIFVALSLTLCSQVKWWHTSAWAPGYKYWALKRFHLEVTLYIIMLLVRW